MRGELCLENHGYETCPDGGFISMPASLTILYPADKGTGYVGVWGAIPQGGKDGLHTALQFRCIRAMVTEAIES